MPVTNSAQTTPTILSQPSPANAFSSGEFLLKLGSRVIPLAAGTQLFTSDIPSLTTTASNGVVAVVNFRSPNELSLGLTNLGDRSWWATDSQGDMKMIEPESTLTLAVGTKIEFGEIEGEVM
ncbi:hypothetical protein [Microcoleus sp. bin38.metabat.b11b12b14.051]|uniref:hypothetical protein n=1 Tax=Microcoleus sp. bin38.metabat.b11b12b14.051 TaxID=2742709 RepID=UPI0025E411CC|nr:hypothetical protein [Microcoleus sp. bin38.metabat.b11b12b14.051]